MEIWVAQTPAGAGRRGGVLDRAPKSDHEDSASATAPSRNSRPRLEAAVSAARSRAVASLEAGETKRLAINASASGTRRWSRGLPSRRSSPIVRIVPSTAAAWPCGSARRMRMPSAATATPAAQQRAKAFDQSRSGRQLGSRNSLARRLCRPTQAKRGRKRHPRPAKLTMPLRDVRGEIAEADQPREIGWAHTLPLGQHGERHAIG
jgi:hypothetical protein